MNQQSKPAQQAERIKGEIASLESEIKRYDADARPVRNRIDQLISQLSETDDALRIGNITDRIRRQRATINTELAAERRTLHTINTEGIEPRKRAMNSLHFELADVLKSLVTADDMQSAVNAASASLAAIVATRQPIEKALKAANDKRAEVEALQRAETDAAEELETLRADAFLLPSNSPKRAAADEAVSNADMVLSVAREKASTARAALPRILAAIAQQTDSLADVDSQISDARQAVAARERDRDLWKAERAYELAIDGMRDAVKSIEDADPEKGHRIRMTLEQEGLRTFDKQGRLNARPQWLRVGFDSL